jgi:hypothetical protein
MILDDRNIERILRSEGLALVENEIAKLTNSYVNREHINFTIGIIKREIINSGLELEQILEIISFESQKLQKFGVEFLLDRKTNEVKLEEEYPEGEELEVHEKSTILKENGLGIGFGIQYAIYYHFLKNKELNLLLEYLKKSRIPKTSRLSKELKEIYKRIDN